MIEKVTDTVTDTICLWKHIIIYINSKQKLWSSILLFGLLKALSAILALHHCKKLHYVNYLMHNIVYIAIGMQ